MDDQSVEWHAQLFGVQFFYLTKLAEKSKKISIFVKTGVIWTSEVKFAFFLSNGGAINFAQTSCKSSELFWFSRFEKFEWLARFCKKFISC